MDPIEENGHIQVSIELV